MNYSRKGFNYLPIMRYVNNPNKYIYFSNPPSDEFMILPESAEAYYLSEVKSILYN